MPLDTPSANIQLTTEQLLQIDTYQKTLANLQSEIDLHSRNLQIVRNDNVTATKEKAFLEEQIANLQEVKTSLEQNNKNIKSSVIDSQSQLEDHKKQSAELKSAQEVKSTELDIREKELIAKEQAYEEQRNKMNDELKKLSEDKDFVSKVYNLLDENIKSIQAIWK